MSELQAAEAEQSEQNEQTEENLQTEQTPESASEGEETPEKKITFSEEQQALVDDIVGKKTFKAREAERKTEALQIELDEAKAKIPQKTRPEVPEIPDPYDDDFEEKVKVRDKAISEAAAFDEREKHTKEQSDETEQGELKRAEEAYQGKIDVYAQRATQLGVSKLELRQAAKDVATYGINGQLIDFIIEQDQGPLITLYLGKNPLELDNLRQMDPLSAAIYINTEIKPKAAVLKKNITSAPDPAETLKGTGVSTERGPKGATYE